MVDYEYVAGQSDKIRKKSEELEEKTQKLILQGDLERMEDRISEYKRREEIGLLGKKDKIMLELYEDRLKQMKKEI